MKLGSLNLKNNLILAPLMNITTPVYRRFCRHFSEIGLVCAPMLYTKRLMKNPKFVEHELYKIEEERPISIQLIGSEPKSLIKAIEYLESYKFDVLDLNAGCPSKRAIKGKDGGYLLNDLKKLGELVNICLKYSSRPVSLKSRLGFETSDNISELAKLINNTELDFVTIHARSVKSGFNESTLNIEALKQLRKMINIPLVGNGDINDPKMAEYLLDYTKADAIMIGRGSMGYPEIFSHIHEFLTKGLEFSHNNSINLMKKFADLYEKYIDKVLEGNTLEYPHEDYKFVELKRNAIWLTKNIKDSTSIRRKLSNTKNIEQLKFILQNFNEN